MFSNNRKFFTRKNESITLLPFLVLWITLAIALPLPGTSSVTFTTYRRVPFHEWEEFYRNRSESLDSNKPAIPGRVREGEIPVAHYSYQIQHPSQREKPEEIPEIADRALITSNRAYRPSRSDKLTFSKQQKPHPQQFYQPISFPGWTRNSSPVWNPNKIYRHSPSIFSQRIYFPTDNLKRKNSQTHSTSDHNHLNVLVEEFANYLEANPVSSAEIREPKYRF